MSEIIDLTDGTEDTTEPVSPPLKRPRRNALAMLMAAARPSSLVGWSEIDNAIEEHAELALIDWIIKERLFMDAGKKVRNFGLAWKQGGGHDMSTPFRAIPPILLQLWHSILPKLPSQVQQKQAPNQVAVKRYQVDGMCRYAPHRSEDVLGYHSDCQYNDVSFVVGISLLSDSTLVFKRGAQIRRVNILRRAVYSMVGEALTDWTHALFDIRSPGRVSLTYRHVRS